MPKQSVTPADERRPGASSDAVRHDGAAPPETTAPADAAPEAPARRPKEYGGPKGPDPVRYGDWEKNGRCIDF